MSQYKVGDWVVITKHVRNWAEEMDSEDGKIVQITELYDMDGGTAFDYINRPKKWKFIAEHPEYTHCRPATPVEIALVTKVPTPATEVEDPLIVEARRRYPRGTNFYPAHLSLPANRYCVITTSEFHNEEGNLYAIPILGSIHIAADRSEGDGNSFSRMIYEKATNKWAEIVNPETPEVAEVNKTHQHSVGDYFVALEENVYGILIPIGGVGRITKLQSRDGSYRCEAPIGHSEWCLHDSVANIKWFKTIEEATKFSESLKPIPVIEKPEVYKGEAVHCTTQEEWNTVLSVFNPLQLRRGDWGTFNCITISRSKENRGIVGTKAPLRYLLDKNWAILSFKDWCSRNKIYPSKKDKAVKKWSSGTYVVCIKDYVSGFNKGIIAELDEGIYGIEEECVNLKNWPTACLPFKECCEWFETKEEAEEFSKKLLTPKTEKKEVFKGAIRSKGENEKEYNLKGIQYLVAQGGINTKAFSGCSKAGSWYYTDAYEIIVCDEKPPEGYFEVSAGTFSIKQEESEKVKLITEETELLKPVKVDTNISNLLLII